MSSLKPYFYLPYLRRVSFREIFWQLMGIKENTVSWQKACEQWLKQCGWIQGKFARIVTSRDCVCPRKLVEEHLWPQGPITMDLNFSKFNVHSLIILLKFRFWFSRNENKCEILHLNHLSDAEATGPQYMSEDIRQCLRTSEKHVYSGAAGI